MSSPVRLPPARWVTHTAAFRRWFGHSKVVDADGKPLVVYHVTRHEFAEFDIKRGDLGAHFGTAEQAREIARYFGVKGQTGARTIPAYLSLRNPLRLDDMGAWSGPAFALQLQKLGLLPADLPVSNWSGAEGREAVRQAIMRGGYDGVVYANTREGRGDSYIAFRAEQIKSAIGNRGTFDLDDPNVLFDRDDRPLETVDPAREFARRPRRRAAGLDEFGLRLFGLRSIDDVLPAYRNLALRPVPAFLRDVDAARALRRELATIDPIASLDDNGNISVGSIDRVEGLTRFADERGLGLLIRRRLAGASILAPNPFLEGMGFVRYGPSVTFAASGGKAQGQQNQVVWSRNLQGAMLYDLTPGSPLPRGMYSALQAAVMGLDAKSMTPGDWQVRLKAMVGKNDVKADEIEWSGVLEWLGLQQGRVAKDAVVEYLRNNGVQVEEVTLRDQQSLDDLTSEQQGDVFRLEELGWEVTADMEDARRVIFVSPDGTDYNAYELQDANDVDDEIKQRALRIADPAQQPAKFGQYQLPGGTNYREVLLTLPAKRRAVRPTVRKLENGRWGLFDGEERIQSFADEAEANRAVFINRGTEVVEGPNYRSNHWDQPNVLAHIRLNDRTSEAEGFVVRNTRSGNLSEVFATRAEAEAYQAQLPASVSTEIVPTTRQVNTLFVEEIQSDWAQQGRKEGFQGPTPQPVGRVEVRGGQWGVVDSSGDFWRAASREAAERSAGIAKPTGIPRAPFVESTDKWVALALKRVLRMAAEGGYDRVAFVNGEQSFDRYSLSHQVEKIDYYTRSGLTMVAIYLEGDTAINLVVSDGIVGRAAKTPEQFVGRRLDEVLGKEVSDRILSDPNDGAIEGGGLKIGGEGMRAFYDKIVPKVLAGVIKKVGGGKATTARIGVGAQQVSAFTGEPNGQYDNYTDQPAIDITPAMREQVMAGLPLFDRARGNDDSIPVPRNILPYWIRTAPQLATAFGRWEAGKITDKALAGAVRAELDKRKERRERAGDRVRGADWLRKRLTRACRTGELSTSQVDLALWLIDKNPAIAADLGISIREGDERSSNGTYNLLTRVVTIFSSRSNEDTATHEILHHTERMMPEDVREGVRKEWLKQLRLAVKNAQASEQQRTMMDWMLEAAEQGDDGLALRLWSLRGQDGASVQDVLPYKLAAASEFWAVNGAALLRQKSEAGTWVQKAKQWLRELVAKVRSLLGLPSDAAVLKGLRAVIAGDGSFVSKSMISAVGSDVVRRDQTRQTETPEFKRWFGDGKVVDQVNTETGLPVTSSREPFKLVPTRMFHTTRNADFEAFEAGRPTVNSTTFGNVTTTRAAIFFTESVEDSNAYAEAEGSATIPVYLKAENPLDLTGGVSETAAEKLVAAGLSERFVYNRMGSWDMFDGEDGAAVVAAAKVAGYDAIVFNDQNPVTGDSFEAWAVFEPTQIKSATGNSGTFDPDDPNILADRTKKRDDVTADVGSDTVRQDRAALPRLKAGASRGVGADIDLWEQGGRADAADPEACESSKWRAAG